MTAQYAFFRDSNGRAAKRTDDKFTPTHLLAELGKSSILQDDGRIGWRGIWSSHDAVFSTILIQDPNGKELNPHDARRILWRAFEDAAKKAVGQPIKAHELLKAADAQSAAFFRRPIFPYVLVTSLSVKTFPAKVIGISGCKISPLASRNPKYPLPKVLLSPQHRNHFADHLKRSNYQLVKVSCSGRTVYEGVENALDGLNLLRALWSYAATYGRYPRGGNGGLRKPVGVIHTGAVITLHCPDGRAANEDIYWFDPDYLRDQELFRDEGRWEKFESDRRWATRKLSNLPYRKELEKILLRYIAALDQANPNIAFLQLWGILERVTDTVGGKYDETIKRSCWVFGKGLRKVMKETLATLRHHRNLYVHAGNASCESDEVVFRIKSFVDPHIGRLLNNTFRVKTLQEYGEVLSYPTDIDTLDKMRVWSTRAILAAKADEKEESEASTRSA